MTGLVAGHLVDGVVDGIQISGLRAFGQIKLAGSRAVFSLYTHFQILLSAVGNNLAQKFGKLSGMLSLFISG